MKAYRATRAGSGLLGAFALVAGLGLAGCSDIDNAMFGSGDDNEQASAAPGTLDNSGPQGQTQSAAPAPRAQAPSSQMAQGDNSVEAGTLPDQSPMTAQAPASMGGSSITPVQIEQGSNTGTAVSTTVANLRSQVMGSRITSPTMRSACRACTVRRHRTPPPITRPRHASPRACRSAHARQSGTGGGVEHGAVVARPAHHQHQFAQHAGHRRRQ